MKNNITKRLALFTALALTVTSIPVGFTGGKAQEAEASVRTLFKATTSGGSITLGFDNKDDKVSPTKTYEPDTNDHDSGKVKKLSIETSNKNIAYVESVSVTGSGMKLRRDDDAEISQNNWADKETAEGASDKSKLVISDLEGYDDINSFTVRAVNFGQVTFTVKYLDNDDNVIDTQNIVEDVKVGGEAGNLVATYDGNTVGVVTSGVTENDTSGNFKKMDGGTYDGTAASSVDKYRASNAFDKDKALLYNTEYDGNKVNTIDSKTSRVKSGSSYAGSLKATRFDYGADAEVIKMDADNHNTVNINTQQSGYIGSVSYKVYGTDWVEVSSSGQLTVSKSMINSGVKYAEGLVNVRSDNYKTNGYWYAGVDLWIPVRVYSEGLTRLTVKSADGKINVTANAESKTGSDRLTLSTKDHEKEDLVFETNNSSANFETGVYEKEDAKSSSTIAYFQGSEREKRTVVASSTQTGDGFLVIKAVDPQDKTNEATVKIPLTVTHKYAINPIEGAPKSITVNNDNKTVKVEAKAKYGNSLSYALVEKTSATANTYRTVSLNAVSVKNDKGTATVEYTSKTNESGTCLLRITGTENGEAIAPETVYVPLAYGTANTDSSSVSESQKTETSSAATVESSSAAETSSAIDSSSASSSKVTKKANTIKVTVKAKNKKKAVVVKFKKLQKKAQKIKSSKLIKVKNAKGKVTYSKKKGSKAIVVSKKGVVKVKKGTKRGTYKFTIAVKAAGNKNFKAKTVTTKNVFITVK